MAWRIQSPFAERSHANHRLERSSAGNLFSESRGSRRFLTTRNRQSRRSEQLAAAKEAYAKFGAAYEADIFPEKMFTRHKFLHVRQDDRSRLGGTSRPTVRIYTLFLRDTKVTDDGLKKSEKLQENITDLFLDNTQISDDGLKHLKGFKHLDTLDLSATKITDAGLKNVNDIDSIRNLFLAHTQLLPTMAEKNWCGLKRLTNLKALPKPK